MMGTRLNFSHTARLYNEEENESPSDDGYSSMSGSNSIPDYGYQCPTFSSYYDQLSTIALTESDPLSAPWLEPFMNDRSQLQDTTSLLQCPSMQDQNFLNEAPGWTPEPISSVFSSSPQSQGFLPTFTQNGVCETPFVEDQTLNTAQTDDQAGNHNPFLGDLSTWFHNQPKGVSNPNDSFFKETILLESIVADFEGNEMMVNTEIQANIERGFMVCDDQWTCYRRNYFSVACSFGLCPSSISEIPLYICRNNHERLSIQGFAMTLSATANDGSDDSQVLVQYDSTRNDKSKKTPRPVSLQPMIPHVFERIQFRKATIVKGKGRHHQNNHHLVLDLYAEALDIKTQRPCWILVARRPSEPIVVRGRSPKYYDDKEDDFQDRGLEGEINSSSETCHPGPLDLNFQHWATAGCVNPLEGRGKGNEKRSEGLTLSSNEEPPAPEWPFQDSGNASHDFLGELNTFWVEAMSKEWKDTLESL